MGYALAKQCMLRGADVTLISGKTALEIPRFVRTVEITSAQEMFEAVKEHFSDKDFIFKAAAVADYTPVETCMEKMKKDALGDSSNLPLKRTPDILKYLGEHKKEGQFLCGFSMETQNLEENSRQKLLRKNADMIAANCLKTEGAGFQGDTNIITLITRNGVQQLGLLTKEETADKIIDTALAEKRRQ